MLIPSILKHLIPFRLKELIKSKLGVPSQEKSFLKLKRLGFTPKLVLDIGAYEGNWSFDFKKIFPSCNILMIEGQKNKEQILKNLTKTHPGLTYKIALLGASEKEVKFNIYDTASSVWEENNDTGAIIESRVLTELDKLLFNTPFQLPDFIKIDTQGYELEILKGGENALAYASAVLLEVSMLDIYKNSPLVHDVLSFMAQRNFLLYDICTLMQRPLDGALYQSDFLFVKKDLFLRENKQWN